MPRIVPDDGTGRERIIICGEMPAQAEEQLGRPLVGPSGQLMMRMMREAGIERRDCYLTNVVRYRHNPKNDIKLVPRAEIDEGVRQLHERLAALHDPWLIIPLGNTALHALTGLRGIVKHRGSIYEYADANGRRIKVIPTIHTAALFRQPSWERRCRLDWKRIAADRHFRELRLPVREHFIEPTFADVCDFVEDARQRAEVLVFDIETPFTRVVTQTTLKSGKPGKPKVTKGPRRMTVFGASFDPEFGFVIPTTEEYWERQGIPLEKVLDQIRELMALPCEKGGQSAAGFDRFWLHFYNIPVTNYVWDTRWMSHAADPLDDHALAYQASIWTREPYWKDDGKDDDTDVEGAYDVRDYWRYNSKDCTVERELVDTHHARLGRRLSYYLRRYVPLFDPMLHISVGGMAVSEKRRVRMHARYAVEQIGIQDALTALAGEPLYGKKGSLSFKKLQKYLYETLRLPKQVDRATGRVSTKEVIVRRLMLKHPAKLGTDKQPEAPGSLILRHRRLEAVKRFTHAAIPDEDGYRRSQYGFTYTLRFTAGKNPRRTGNNSQNDDREILGMFVPDPGHIFIEVDLSQAEDRVVKTLAASLRSTVSSRREELLWRARAWPWENDEHKRAAVLIHNSTTPFPETFPITKRVVAAPLRLEDVTKEQRYLAKRARHASNYGMMGKTLSDQFLKDGYVFPPEECDRMIATILDKDVPEVRDWQRWVRQTVLRDKQMTNGWGGIVDVRYERLDDNLYREMYAYQPQSEVTGIIKYWGLVPLHDVLAHYGGARVVNEKHDSLLISVLPDMVWDIIVFLRGRLERPRLYNGVELMIPCEFKLGMDASMPVEFKRFPERDELEAAVKKLVG